MEFKVGDRVEVIKSKRARVGVKGTIFSASYGANYFGVEFDEPVFGCHDGDGTGKDRHCWYYYSKIVNGRKVLYTSYGSLIKVGKKNNYY